MKTRKTIALMLALLMVWAALPWQKAAAGAAYDRDDIAVINGIIDAHPELGWPKAPADGSSVPDAWTGKVIWRLMGNRSYVIEIDLSRTGIFGALNVSGLPSLEKLSCCNKNNLTELNVSGLGNLKTLDCYYNNGLTALDVSGLGSLKTLNCYNNGLTELNVSGLGNLNTLHCYGNSLTALDVSGLGNLNTLYCFSNGLTELDVSGLSALKYLYCNNNQLTGLNVSGLTNLQELDCNENQLTGLNVSGLTNLQKLYCYENQLTGLNVSGLTALEYLYCHSNQLTGTLDVSGLTNLQELHCYNNQLTGLNVSGLTALEYLYCHSNQLTGTLDVSGLTNLQELRCIDNQLTGLNVSGLTNLQVLYCEGNQLTGLNVSGLTNLQVLSCYLNQLTGLNVSGLTNLQVLSCGDNQLTGLNVSGLSNLQVLFCDSNQLTGLNVSGLSALTHLYCEVNQLTGLNVSGLSNLQQLHCYHNYMADRSAVTGREINWDGTNFRFDPQYVFLSFTAEQTGGANGTADSTGIKLTFNKDVVPVLPANEITLTNGTGEATKGSGVTGSGQTWNLALAQVTKPGDIYVSIANFGANIVTGDALPVWVHKAGVPVSTVTVTKGTASRSPALPGETVTLTADAAPGGQHFVEWNISPPVQFTDGTGKQSSTAKFIMPAENVTAEAIYAGEFNRADIAVINNIIAANGWKVPQAPADGSSVPGEWNEKVRWTGDVFNRRVKELVIREANLTGTLDVSGLTALTFLHCNYNQLTGLNVSGLTALQELYCEGNQLTGTLDVSGLTALAFLHCDGNQLTGLNVSGLTNLYSLDCGANQLTGLNVSGLTALTYLDCEKNQLTGLNVSGLTALAFLYCEGNQLTGLNVSGLTNLEVLDCDANQLTGLDVNGLTNLHQLHCNYNQLTGLNVSGLSALQNLKCNNNQLTGLNVSGLSALQDLNCNNNQLTGTLDVSGLPALEYLYCKNNQLTGLALNQGAPYSTIDTRYNYMANTGAVTGRAINWDEVNYRFAPQYRRISYDANGGSGQMQAGKAVDGEAFTLRENGFTAPSGQRFKAWAIGDVNGPQKKAGEQHTFNADTTVYAIWHCPVTGVTLNKNTATLTVGGSETLTATVAPENATNKAVTWSSDKPAVATVDQSGKVIAVAPGTATITVKTADGEKTATCAVTVVVPVTGVKLNKTATTLAVGGSETLTATVAPENATNKAVTWSSDKPAVATVDQSGKVIAVGGGTATITIKTADGEKTATCAVTVVAPVTGVSLKKTATSMVVGGTETLFAILAPANATNRNITWSSDKPDIATVDTGGKVIAAGVGTATITVKTADGGKTATCTVTVSAAAVPVTGVKLDKATAALPVGGAETLYARVEPATATNQNVTWSSDKPGIATVDNGGKVIAVAPGTATITVTTQDGGKTATCTVTVSTPVVTVTGVTLNKAATALLVGGAETLFATVEPAAATNRNVTWSSDNTAVATVDTGGKVIAVAVGTATITVTTVDGGKTATCTVTVSAAAVPVTGVKLNRATATLTVSGAETLYATVEPATATNQNVTWSSDKPDIATVDNGGKVIAVAPGTATITVTTADGGKMASCSITVQPAAAPFAGTVTFDKGAAQVGEPITITWDLPEGASQCSVHAYYWYVKEEGSDARILAESGGGADMSSISFTPTKGKELMLELYLKDSDNQIYTYQSAWISIGGDDPVLPASKGDANNDGAVDILDLVSIIEYIVNGAEPVSKEGADANGDKTVDILDLVWIIEMIVKE